MRTLGDHRWINDWIGLPYRLGARGPDEFDCYGLCAEIYSEMYGITLPDWQEDTLELKGRATAIANVVCSGTWTPTEHPQDGDFAIAYRTKAAHHLGLVFASGVLHSIEGAGVVYEPLNRFEDRFTRVEYGEWSP